MSVGDQGLMPGPTVKPTDPSPCGCRVSPETGTEQFRLWFCRTHAAAFAMLQALQVSLKALDMVIEQMPTSLPDDHPVHHARVTVQTTIHRAIDSYGYDPAA